MVAMHKKYLGTLGMSELLIRCCLNEAEGEERSRQEPFDGHLLPQDLRCNYGSAPSYRMYLRVHSCRGWNTDRQIFCDSASIQMTVSRRILLNCVGQDRQTRNQRNLSSTDDLKRRDVNELSAGQEVRSQSG